MITLFRYFLALALIASAQAAPFKFGELTINVPDGFSLERIATTAQAPRPISGAFDDRGRLYVTDSAGMSDGAEKQLVSKAHRLLRLEDTDGDGKFDKHTVFADKLMFPEGCLFYEGSVYVAAPPEIWKFTDTNDDGVADKREVWFDGKTLTHCGNDLHGPYLGRDGMFYWTKGAYAEQHYMLPNGKPLDTHAAHIFRARPDGTMMEPVLTGGMANPVGVAFTAKGQRFLSGTFFVTPADGQRDGLIHSIYGGVYGMDRESLHEHPMTGEVMPILYGNGASAPCGMTCLESDGLGVLYSGSLVTCYFNLHKVVRHQLQSIGASFKTKDSDLVWSDSPDFHPTDVIEDADGSLIIIDTGGWYKICCPTSQLAKPDVLGGIYRLRRADAKPVEYPRGSKLNWATLPPSALLDLLSDERHLVARRAIAELAQRQAVDALQPAVRQAPIMSARTNAVWALHRIPTSEARAAIRRVLQEDYLDPDNDPVLPALASIALWRDRDALDLAIGSLRRGFSSIVRAAAEACGRIGDKRAVGALLDASGKHGSNRKRTESGCPENPSERAVEHSLIYALIEIGDAEGTRAGLKSSNSHEHRTALVALDQMRPHSLKSEDVVPLLKDKNDELRNTAQWIVGQHPDWGDALADYFRERLGKSADDALAKQLAQLARSPAIVDVIASGARQGNATALRAMAAAAPGESPAAWLDALAEVLGKAGTPVLGDAVIAAQALPLPKGGHQVLRDALIRVGESSGTATQLRLDALAAARKLPKVSDALFEFLIAQLMPSQPIAARSAAASVLARAKLSDAQLLTLADALSNVGPLELPKLLPAFERNAGSALGQRLVTALQNAAGFNGLRADLLKTMFAKYPADIQAGSQPLLTRLNADIAKQAAQLADLLGRLPAGDVRRGQAVFQRAGCIACHRIGYAGGTIGPDVTNIGKVRTPRDLLEAIVFPSASIVRGYETHTLTTKTNEVFTGTLAKDERDEVILNIAPLVRQRIARDRIAQMNPINISLMPQGFGELLKSQDLADLLAFLQPPAPAK